MMTMASFRKLSFIALALFELSCAQVQIPLGGGSSNPASIASIPALGFGTWNLDKSNASEVVSVAIQTGYRHLDCAAIYGNEKEVGNGIKDGLEATRLHRSSVWITSKLWNDQYVSVTLLHAFSCLSRLTQCAVAVIRRTRLSKGSIRL